MNPSAASRRTGAKYIYRSISIPTSFGATRWLISKVQLLSVTFEGRRYYPRVEASHVLAHDLYGLLAIFCQDGSNCSVAAKTKWTILNATFTCLPKNHTIVGGF